MILGLGVDIVDIDRIKEKIISNEAFMNIVFSSDEILLCKKRNNPYESFAAKFAAKEAFLKAIGTGLLAEIELNNIEVLNNEKGAPYIAYNSFIEQLMFDLFKSKPQIHVSLSHSKFQAIATVILS